jgi:hypothetical protein
VLITNENTLCQLDMDATHGRAKRDQPQVITCPSYPIVYFKNSL